MERAIEAMERSDPEAAKRLCEEMKLNTVSFQ